CPKELSPPPLHFRPSLRQHRHDRAHQLKAERSRHERVAQSRWTYSRLAPFVAWSLQWVSRLNAANQVLTWSASTVYTMTLPLAFERLLLLYQTKHAEGLKSW